MEEDAAELKVELTDDTLIESFEPISEEIDTLNEDISEPKLEARGYLTEAEVGEIAEPVKLEDDSTEVPEIVA